MAVAKRLSTTAETGVPGWQELDRVKLRVDRQEERGSRTVPAGAAGTIVAVLKNGEAYIVEFAQPVEALVTVEPEDITPADPKRA